MKLKTTLFTAFLVLSVGSLSAADKKMMEPSKEDRAKMAEMHMKMAECLKTDKPMKECHEEMMKACKDSMDKSGCPMMGMGKDHMMMGKDHMKDMMKGKGMMDQGEEKKPEAKK